MKNTIKTPLYTFQSALESIAKSIPDYEGESIYTGTHINYDAEEFTYVGYGGQFSENKFAENRISNVRTAYNNFSQWRVGKELDAFLTSFFPNSDETTISEYGNLIEEKMLTNTGVVQYASLPSFLFPAFNAWQEKIAERKIALEKESLCETCTHQDGVSYEKLYDFNEEVIVVLTNRMKSEEVIEGSTFITPPKYIGIILKKNNQ